MREWVDLGGRQSAVPPWADFEAVGGVFMKGRDELFLRGGMVLASGCAVKRGGHIHTQDGGQDTRLEGVPCGMGKALLRDGEDI